MIDELFTYHGAAVSEVTKAIKNSHAIICAIRHLLTGPKTVAAIEDGRSYANHAGMLDAFMGASPVVPLGPIPCVHAPHALSFDASEGDGAGTGQDGG